MKDFGDRLQDQLSRLEGGSNDDILRKYGTLLSFDFEAAVRLKAWNDLSRIIDVGHAIPLFLDLRI